MGGCIQKIKYLCRVKRLSLLWRYIKWFWQAKTKYQIHSPFVFTFIKDILEDKRTYYAFKYIEKLRKLVLSDARKVQVNDFGAGSYIEKQKERKVSGIAKTSLTSPLFCRMLFKMVNSYQSRNILEMGTSLGISTLYLAHAGKKGQVNTMEGCPNITNLAQENFDRLETTNIKVITGEFDKTLPSFLDKTEPLDFVFIDGNHRYEPTIRYYEWCLKKSHENTIFVFDDIYWSDEMVQAWEAIKEHPSSLLTIDLFFMGIVFLRKEQKIKEHFKLVPASWKPWVLGFLSN